MTLAEAAAELGLNPGTLRRQIHRGSLRARKVGRDWTVSRRECERYRAEHLGRRRPSATP
jgi:excisionase family DNA binding protein